MSTRTKTLLAALLALVLAFLAGYLYRRSRAPTIEEKAERAAEEVKESWRKLTK